MPQAAPLAKHAQVADPVDLEKLYLRHGSAVRALLQRLLGPETDPEDVLQDVFVVAWRKRERFDNPSAFSYLCSTAVKLAADARKRARVRRLFGLDQIAEFIDPRDPERDAQQSEDQRLVYRVLDGMSEKRRTVFILFEIQGMTGPEIAQLLDCPVRTVWTRLFHARAEFIPKIKKFAAAAPQAGRR